MIGAIGRRRLLLAAAAGAGVVAVASVMGAPLSGGGFSINPSAFTGGGGTSSGVGYTVSGVIGQPVVTASSGSGYTVGAGLFAAMEAGEPTYRVIAPGLAANP